MYSSSLGYDDSLNLDSSSDLLEVAAWHGIARLSGYGTLFSNPVYRDVILSEFITKKYAPLFKENTTLLTYIFNKADKSGYNLCDHPSWSEFLEEMYQFAITNGQVIYEASRASDHFLNYYLKWNKNVDWMEVYNLYFAKQKFSSYICEPFSNSIRKYLETNPLCAKISIEAELFESDDKPDSVVRGEMYVAYINAGFLDKKRARKIRSESSEFASNKGVNALLDIANNNPALYPNFSELILQFSDTKYPEVQNSIATKAPYNLLYAFVGFDSSYAKQKIEKRMQDGK